MSSTPSPTAASTPPGWPCWPGCSPATPPCKVAWGGLRLVRSGGGADDDDRLAELESALRLHDIAAAEAGGIEDMNAAADVIYGR